MKLLMTMCVVGLTAGAAPAGDLAPAGPPAPTMKTLTEVEPRTPIRNDFDTPAPVVIDQPGSYYLVEDIIGFPGQNGITIAASDVTLDLAGFRVLGNLEVGSNRGIDVVAANHRNITIRNGTVRNFGGAGAYTVFADGARLEDVTSSANGAAGFDLGPSSIVVGCVATNNGADGFTTFQAATLDRCAASNNGEHGFDVWESAMTGCVADSNTLTGFNLLRCNIASSEARNNSEHGYFLNQGSAEGCTSFANTMSGFRVQRGVARGSAAINNDAEGFALVFNGRAIDCVASSNAGAGFLVDGGSAIDSTAENNAIGFDATGSAGRIEGCQATDNTGNGFRATGTGNFFARNTSTGFPLQFNLGAGNAWGPIVVISGAGDISAVVNANHPWANFRY